MIVDHSPSLGLRASEPDFGEDTFPGKSLLLSLLPVLFIVRTSTPLQIKSEANQYLIVSNILTIYF